MTAFDPIQPLQGINEPLALKDSGDPERFNRAAERNLTDIKALADGLNSDFIPKANEFGAGLAASAQSASADAAAAKASETAAKASETGAAQSAATATNAAAAAGVSREKAAASESACESMEREVRGLYGGLTQGATPEPLPGSPMARDASGRSQAEDPAADKDVANKRWVEQGLEAVLERVAAPDGENLVLDGNGDLNLGQGVRETLGYVDTGGGVSAAIANSVIPRAGQEEVDSGADVNKYVAPKELTAWAQSQKGPQVRFAPALTAPSGNSYGQIVASSAGSLVFGANAPTTFYRSNNDWYSSVNSGSFEYQAGTVSMNGAYVLAPGMAGNNLMQYSNNGGASFASANPGFAIGGACTNENGLGFCVRSTYTQSVYKSTGLYSGSWVEQQNVLPVAQVWGPMLCSGQNFIMFPDSSNQLAVSQNGGTSWGLVYAGMSGSSRSSLSMSGDVAVFMQGGNVYISRNGGLSWSAVSIPASVLIGSTVAGVYVSGTYAAARLNTNAIAYSRDKGVTWSRFNLPTQYAVSYSITVNGNLVYICGVYTGNAGMVISL